MNLPIAIRPNFMLSRSLINLLSSLFVDKDEK